LFDIFAFFFNILSFLGRPHFDVALRGEVWSNSAMGSVGSPASFGCTVGLHVFNGEIFEVFGISIGL
jgi:hypothetical protein